MKCKILCFLSNIFSAQQKYSWGIWFFSHTEAYLNTFRKLHPDSYRIWSNHKQINIHYIGYPGAQYYAIIALIGNTSNKIPILFIYFLFINNIADETTKYFSSLLEPYYQIINTLMLVNISCPIRNIGKYIHHFIVNLKLTFLQCWCFIHNISDVKQIFNQYWYFIWRITHKNNISAILASL